jgi:hypothetical protein
MQDVSVGSVTITLESTNLSNTGGTDGCATQYEIQTTAAAIAGDFTLSASRGTLCVVRSYSAVAASPPSSDPFVRVQFRAA